MNSIRTRIIVLVAICILAIGGAVVYIGTSRAHQTGDRANVTPASKLAR